MWALLCEFTDLYPGVLGSSNGCKQWPYRLFIYQAKQVGSGTAVSCTWCTRVVYTHESTYAPVGVRVKGPYGVLLSCSPPYCEIKFLNPQFTNVADLTGSEHLGSSFLRLP